jgi:hypothetical protein
MSQHRTSEPHNRYTKNIFSLQLIILKKQLLSNKKKEGQNVPFVIKTRDNLRIFLFVFQLHKMGCIFKLKGLPDVILPPTKLKNRKIKFHLRIQFNTNVFVYWCQ